MSAAEHEAAIGRLLAELGDTADKVADALRAKGIKGRRVSARSCPVTTYLKARRPALDTLTTTQGWVRFRDPDSPTWPTIPTTEPVREFVRRFDQGVYLDLVEVP